MGPLIKPFPAPNSVVLLDNAPIHDAVGTELRGAVKRANTRLQHRAILHDLAKVDLALQQVTASQGIRYFSDCGYHLSHAARVQAVELGFIQKEG